MVTFADEMLRLPQIITKTLSVRLSLMVASAMTILLMASLVVILLYSQRTIKAEALQKASKTLEIAVEQIDNILLSVEQATGNTYFSMLPHLQDPDMIAVYCRKMVEANPHVSGCAIAYVPHYLKDHETFMTYMYRKGTDIEESAMFGDKPYFEESWFTEALKAGGPTWVNPLKDIDTEIEPLITFCLPVRDYTGEKVAVMGVDVTLSVLSRIISETKPSPHSHCVLLDKEGSFIVYPDGEFQKLQSTLTLTGQNRQEHVISQVLEEMISGETDYQSFMLDHSKYYVFYKPFERNAVTARYIDNMGWTAGIIYPEGDIVGDYHRLLNYVMAIAFVGLLLLFILCRAIIHRQLKPLTMLTKSAQHIARGNYSDPIPPSHREDEIGRLQENFRQMQQTLASHISELEQLTTTLQKHGEELQEAYDQAQKADRMKVAFLHNMTNQMVGPAETIDKDVDDLWVTASGQTVAMTRSQLAEDIQKNGITIANLLDNLLNMSDDEMRKEVAHV